MPSQIVTVAVEMDDHGDYYVSVVDYLNDTTMRDKMPDHLVSMLPVMLQQLQRQLK